MKTDELNRHLSFSLGQEEFAIPLLCVKEVIAIPEITPVPFTPAYFVGIMNLRGQVISIIDLRQKFNIKANTTADTAVVICEMAPLCLGIIVDSVNSVLTPEAENLSEKPAIQSSKSTDYITSVYRKDKRLVLLLDIAKTLSLEDHMALNKAASSQAAGSQSKKAA